MPSDYEQAKAALWTGKETAAALEALERMHQREKRIERAVRDYRRVTEVDDPGKILDRIQGAARNRLVRDVLAALADTPACSACGFPKSQHRDESAAHHSECTLQQFRLADTSEEPNA